MAKQNRTGDLNDSLRRNPPYDDQLVITPGLHLKGPEFVGQAIEAVANFSAFDEYTDPYGARDYGVLEIGGVKICWKIDVYEKARTVPARDPADSEGTDRVLTIMLETES